MLWGSEVSAWWRAGTSGSLLTWPPEPSSEMCFRPQSLSFKFYSCASVWRNVTNVGQEGTKSLGTGVKATLNQGTKDYKHVWYKHNHEKACTTAHTILQQLPLWKNKTVCKDKANKQKQASSTHLSLILSKCYQDYLLPPYLISQSNGLLNVPAS